MPKRVTALNAKQIARWKPDPFRTLELVDGAVPGLRLRQTPNGLTTWSLNVRINGTRRRIGIGEGLGLAEARRMAEDARSRIARGHDPTADRTATRERRKAAEKGIGTLGSVIAAYYESGPGTELKAGKAARALIERIFADHLLRPSLDVTMPELQILIDHWRSRSSGRHCAAYFRPVARWGAKRGLMTKADPLEAPAKSGEVKQRVLTVDEVGPLLRELGWTAHALAARFMLLTGARSAEACDVTWGEIDLDKGRWTIAASRRKNTRRTRLSADHVVSLPRQAVTLLRQLERGSLSELVFLGERGARLSNWPRWSARLKNRLGFEVSPHALRRTCSTLAGNLGHPPHVISALLGHRAIGGQLISGYNQSRYTREVEAALQQVADFAEALAADDQNVVAFKRLS
jgi:integrase